MFSTRNWPPVTGSARANPAANPPGTSLTMCAGRMSLNSSRHAGYGCENVTTAVLPPSMDCTPVIRS